MHIEKYIGLVHNSEKDLADAFKMVSQQHADEPDVYEMCKKLGAWSENHFINIQKFVERYSESKSAEPDKLKKALFAGPRSGSLALIRDFHDLWLMANEVQLCWIVLLQASRALRDKELELACEQFDKQTNQQLDWLLTRIKQAAPQALVTVE